MFEPVSDFYDELLVNWLIIQQMMAPLRLTKWQMFKLFLAQINRDNPVLAKVVLLSIVGFWLWVFSKVIAAKSGAAPLSGVGVVKAEGRRKDAFGFIQGDNRKYPDTPYLFESGSHRCVIYPPSTFDEIKRLTEDEASTQDFFRTVSQNYFGTASEAVCKTIALDLTKNISIRIPAQQKESRIAFDKYIGYCPDFKPMPLFEVCVRILASMNASALLGRDIGTSEWPTLVHQLAMAVASVSSILKWVPSVLRPVVQPLLGLPLLRIQMVMRNTLSGVIRRDIEVFERAADKKEILKPTSDGKFPFTHWLIARYKPGEATRSQLISDHILINVEATLKSAMMLQSIITELATRPDLQDELRNEVGSVLVNGQLPSTSLKELRKMDSVMKEAARLHPFSLFTLHRQTRVPLQLSTGPLLPPGTLFCVDARSINTSPVLFPKPEAFDAQRFSVMRSKPSLEQCYRFVSTGPSEPNFGDGAQVCPGRFWANAVLKVCLAHLLMNYRIEAINGDARGERVALESGIFIPNMELRVAFQSRN